VASPEEDGGRGQTCEQEDSDENQTWRPEIADHESGGDRKRNIRHEAHHVIVNSESADSRDDRIDP